MKFSLALAGLSARRFLSPSGLALLVAALALALLLPWSPAATRGAGEFSRAVNAGLARQGVCFAALGMALPWFVARAASCARHWRHGEGDWLGTGALSRASVACSHVLGAALALALALLPFALAGEWRAHCEQPSLQWLADSDTASVVLLRDSDRASLQVEVPRGASVALARFVVAAPDDGGPSATLRSTIARAGQAPISRDTLISNATSLELPIEGGAGPATLSFERVGRGAVLVLEGPRLRWFAARPTPWGAALALYLQAWLCGTALLAIALGLAAWVSTGSAFLCAAALLAGAGLIDRAPPFWPGVGLGDALELCGAGYAPGYPALATWLGTLAAIATGLLLPALQRDLWRREA